MKFRTLAAIVASWSAFAVGPRSLSADASASADFFESQVRPVLIEHCYSCHGEKKQKGNLRLDSRAAILKGNENGPALIAGKPDESLLIRAIHYDGDVKMPPKGKLPTTTIDALTRWVKEGAVWPDGKAASTKSMDKVAAISRGETARKHWAFRPIASPSLPTIKNSSWAKSPIDSFVLSKLESNDLAPAPPADRRTLIRRATYSLTGLPPTPEEIDAFVADDSPDAFTKVIDRLLASPHYGERWARHWLDVARYADTKGYLPGNVELRYPYAYTYRDYVIKAFNEDLPYDQFIVHQLAADQLLMPSTPPTHQTHLAAMGFLTLGRRFLNNPHDIIDDRIDVVSRGLLGLTVSCARCHDHKYDPIPTKDYYSLYAVFAASTEPSELPLIAAPEQTEAYAAFEKELKIKEQVVTDFRTAKLHESLGKLRSRVGDYLLAVRAGNRLPGEDAKQLRPPEDVNQILLRRFRSYVELTRKQPHPILAAWHAFAALPSNEFDAKASAVTAQLLANADPKNVINPIIITALSASTPKSLSDVAKLYNEVFSETEKQWQELRKTNPSAAVLTDPTREAIRQLLDSPEFPLNVPPDQAERLLDRATRDKLRGLQRQVDQFKVQSPVAPPRAMVLKDVAQPGKQHVYLRGNPGNWGEQAPRQFLAVLSGEDRKPFAKGSGRLELAQAIASKDNPLTARVWVNRVWLHHFGAGLVRTPGDFGTRGEPPTHPELLDDLSHRFIADGWSLKKLHRRILLSSAYQQSSESAPLSRERAEKMDPENRLLWKMNRQRLDFEALRDSLIAVSGSLDSAVGGRSVNLSTRPFSNRRTVYGFIDRQNLPSVMRAFDFANPDSTSPQRYQTTVPQQALFLMNGPFVVEQARKLVNRSDVQMMEQTAGRIQRMYRLAYGRNAEPDEVAVGLRFLESAQESSNDQTIWEKYAQVLLLSNEFAFVD